MTIRSVSIGSAEDMFQYDDADTYSDAVGLVGIRVDSARVEDAPVNDEDVIRMVDVFIETDFIDVSAGAADAGKPIKLDAAGHIDASMINSADVDHDATTNFLANEHIDWTNAAATLNTTGSINTSDYYRMDADLTSDTAPNDDTTEKKFSIQKLGSAPTNAAYIAFTNNPGADVFYIVLEES